MSLQGSRLPRLIDKFGTKVEAEKVREKLEKKDQEVSKIIKKASNKK